MARYIVCVAETTPTVTPAHSSPAKPWLSIVEAESPLMAAYEYPGYQLAYKQAYFLAEHRDVGSIYTNWGDVVQVTALDAALGTLLTGQDEQQR
jgi:hypothetical protein